jgi:hypothetical protein
MTITIDEYATYPQYDARVNEKIRALHLGNLNKNNNFMFSNLRNRSQGYTYLCRQSSVRFDAILLEDYFKTNSAAFTTDNELADSGSSYRSINLDQFRDGIFPVKKSGANAYYLILHVFGVDVEVRATLPRSGISITVACPISPGPVPATIAPTWNMTVDNQILTSRFESIEYEARAINPVPDDYRAHLFAVFLEEAVVPAADMP